jgi:hypothetical protein
MCRRIGIVLDVGPRVSSACAHRTVRVWSDLQVFVEPFVADQD